MLDSKKKSLFYGCFAVFFLIFPSQLALNRPWQIAVNVGVAMFIGFGLLFTLLKDSKIHRAALPALFLLGTLLTASIISSGFNEWFRPLLAYGAFAGAMIISLFLIGGLRNPICFVKTVVLGTVLSSLILIAASFAIEPLSFYRYQGIFNNPNNMGFFTAGVFALLIGALYENRLNWSRAQRIFLWALLSVHLLLLLASNSRASFTAALVVIFLFIAFPFIDAVSITHIRIRDLKKFGFIAFFILLLGAGLYFIGLLDPILEKFFIKFIQEDFTDIRVFAWSASISHWTWFGLGPHSAVEIGRAGKVTGHSTYISQFTKYGLIPAVLFVAILVYIWFRALYGTRKGSVVAPTLIATLTGFIVNAAFETGASTPGLWLVILLFSAFLADNQFKGRRKSLIQYPDPIRSTEIAT